MLKVILENAKFKCNMNILVFLIPPLLLLDQIVLILNIFFHEVKIELCMISSIFLSSFFVIAWKRWPECVSFYGTDSVFGDCFSVTLMCLVPISAAESTRSGQR